jgi:hypothetical protein
LHSGRRRPIHIHRQLSQSRWQNAQKTDKKSYKRTKGTGCLKHIKNAVGGQIIKEGGLLDEKFLPESMKNLTKAK